MLEARRGGTPTRRATMGKGSGMNTATEVIHISPDENLGRYLNRIHTYPLLEAEEELSLTRRWRAGRDPAAVQTLVSSHLRLVAKIALGYRGYGLPVADLIAEGNLGLMQALDRFDPERGFRLATYAMWWIRASIQEYVLRSWSVVKLGTTTAQKRLFFNLRKLKGRIQALEEGDLPPETVTLIGNRLGVPEKDVILMNRRLQSVDPSLNAPLNGDGESQWQDWLVADGEDQETSLAHSQELIDRRRLLAGAMERLSERERTIIVERRLKDEPSTLEDLSRVYEISRERVRQIEAKAMEKLQKSIRNTMITERLAS
jgi:RNA polymerase sigma-32 factor